MQADTALRTVTTSMTAVVVACATWAGETGKAPQRGRMLAVIVKEGPPIDGVGEAGTWAKCPPLPLGDCTGVGPGAAKTTARVVFDATRLYVAWQCADSGTDSLTQDATRRDGDVWQDDCVELFVTGDPREGYF
ncbi:MAG: sugar-binding protein, partial [Phycisphaerae bacterium]